MAIDFTARKLEQQLDLIEDPFEFEVLECLYEKYITGEINVQFVDGEPFFSLRHQPESAGVQLELPLE